MDNRISLPLDTVDLILARKKAGMTKSSIEVDGYTVMVRKSTNSGDRPKNAKNLMSCKGLKGCEFAECAEKVFGVGKLPKNLIGLKELCSVNPVVNSIDNPI